MAVGEVAEVIAAPFTAYIAPVSTTFPAVSTAEGSVPSTWTKIGTSGFLNYSDAGVTVTHTQTEQAFVSAGGITPRKKWRTETGMTVAFELVDLSPEGYAVALDSAVKKTGAVSRVELKRGILVAYWSLLLRGTSTLNESKKAQYEITACCQAGAPAPKFSLKQGPAMLALQYDVLEMVAGKWADWVVEE